MGAKTKAFRRRPIDDDTHVKIIETGDAERMESDVGKSMMSACTEENPDTLPEDIITYAKSCAVDQLSGTSEHGVKSIV